jgi:hypothetical protein
MVPSVDELQRKNSDWLRELLKQISVRNRFLSAPKSLATSKDRVQVGVAAEQQTALNKRIPLTFNQHVSICS